MLNKTFRKLSVGVSAVALALAASASWAQTPDVCTVVGGDTPDITIAVASNFYEPAQDVAENFLASLEFGDPNFEKVIRVCHNSTGLLRDEINGGNLEGFSLFLAANNTAPNQLTVPTIGLSTTYALGVPVLWSYIVRTSNLMSNVINTAQVSTLAVGDPSLAPYGKAAENILKSLNQWPGEPGQVVTPVINLYDNIDLTFLAIKTDPNSAGNDAGFVSRTQVCGFLPLAQNEANMGIVEFPDFSLIQDGILISRNTDENALASALFDYLLLPGTQQFLVDEHCYASADPLVVSSK